MNPRRLKASLLISGVVLAGLALLAWTQPWVAIDLSDGRTLVVSGDRAAGAVSALALTCLVLNGALSIASHIFRVVLGALEALIGATLVLVSSLALGSPVTASAAALSEVTGVSGNDSLVALVASISVTGWPWVSVAAGALLIALGLAVLASAARWPGSGRKYGAVRMQTLDGVTIDASNIDDWDALSRGNDPT